MRETIEDQSACAWMPCSHVRCACRYDLHVLLVEHGKRCPRCAKIPGRPQERACWGVLATESAGCVVH